MRYPSNLSSGILWTAYAGEHRHTVTRLLLFLLSLYKRWLSPLLGARCRFHPSCSDYARVAIARFGPLRGGTLSAWRILRCQPLCEGGHDPVPDQFVLRRCGAQGAHTHD
ncbi:membrane protein insertion efficiency factor YidD [Luteibacter flocculans]|uniref:Putative membrane protein insertion efficiency factor n=1 Tax=Luteibacter flocculans TaxID=2780091 RepID=A0ABY4T072_9GAMM|nr:membrane protein insertion efficiency factor YidD [Luteibacter flocculans]